MRKGISFLLCLLAPVALRGQETASEVGELLEQLSSEMYRARTEATDGLIALGEAAEGAVEARLRQSEDPETKTRCTYILRMVRASRVRRALLPPLPEVSLDFDGLPFPDALSRLEAAGGFPFDHENLPTAATTIHCKAVTPFEALDALCRSVGASWRIHMGFFSPEAGDPTKLQVERPFEGSIENEAAPSVPVAYARHYRVAATSISLSRESDFRAATLKGEVSLGLWWWPGVRPREIAEFRADSAVDEKGRDLLSGGSSYSVGRSGAWRSDPATARFGLKLPDGDVSCIASLKGHVLLRFPMSFETISFDPPDRCVGEVREVRGVRIVLKEYRVAHGALFVKVNAEGTPVLEDPPADWPKFSGPMRVADLFGREDVRITAIGGRTLNTVRSAGSGCSGEGATRYRHVEIEFGVGEDFQPGPVIVTCTVGYFYDGFNFELKDIPFPR